MRQILTIILFMTSLLAQAQLEFAPIGAEWYYTEPYQKKSNYILMESIGDTIINEQKCRVLRVTRNGYELVSQEYIAQIGDTILYYNSNTNGFNTLYNFAAQVGDTIHVHSQPFQPTDGFLSTTYFFDDGIIPYFSYRILKIDSIEVSGVWLKQQEVDFLTNDDRWGFSNITGGIFLNEGIGSLTYFFGKGNWIVPEESISLLRCYNDSILEFKNPLWASSCTLVSSVEVTSKQHYRVYPNPTNDILHVELNNDEQVVQIQIVDDSGRIRVSEQIAQSSHLNISHLKPGYYILRIFNRETDLNHKILVR
jgi:hypothetical protein